MGLENYRDISTSGADVSAGFQFEFVCARCSRKWKSPFKPYRMGQITGVLGRFAFLFGNFRTAGRTTGNFADMGSRGARQKALDEAMVQAERLYQTCPSCRQGVCADCFSTRDDKCLNCIEQQDKKVAEQARREKVDSEERKASACPNCGSHHAGGRFCAECGFDMASTHKSCPACAAMMARQARFCTDCGHSF